MTAPTPEMPEELERIARAACGCLWCQAVLSNATVYGNQTPCMYEANRAAIQAALAQREREIDTANVPGPWVCDWDSDGEGSGWWIVSRQGADFLYCLTAATEAEAIAVRNALNRMAARALSAAPEVGG